MSPTRLALVTALGTTAMAAALAVARPRVARYLRWRRLDPAARAVVGRGVPAPLAIPDRELADLVM